MRARTPSGAATEGTAIGSDVDPANAFPIYFAYTDADAYHLHYAVISNPLIWFAHHYLWNIATEPVVDKAIHRAWIDGYSRVNAAIAERAVAVAREQPRRPLFLTQDYQLYLAPERIRRELARCRHAALRDIPWPELRYS
jgi:trehalose 6-phosphate synthase